MKTLSVLFISLALIIGASAQETPKNIILLIGDGMGLAQITAGITVADNTQHIESFKQIGLVDTHSADDYVTDSAAGATAFSTGQKTNNGMVAVTPSGETLKTILEMAAEDNMATGVVSTSSVTHATPAAFVAHEESRNSHEAIAQDFANSDIDVFMGGGLKHFEHHSDAKNLIPQLEKKGFQIIKERSNLDQISPESLKVAALLDSGHLKRYSDGRGDLLPEMTTKSLEILSKNEKGFFLMVEASQIDWGGHANSIDYITSEFYDFDQAIGVALDFAKKDKNTLVIVTADHETGGLGLNGYDPEENEIDAEFTSRKHTGILIPMFSFGPGAEEFTGFFDNTDVFKKMVNLLGL